MNKTNDEIKNKEKIIEREIIRRITIFITIGFPGAIIMGFGFQMEVGAVFFMVWVIGWILVTPILVRKQFEAS